MPRLIDILRSKPARYWAQAVALIVVGIWAGHYISSHDGWLETRYSLYGLMQKTNWHRQQVQHTFVVTVDDDDYWKGDFNRRAPIRRDLLARLVSKLAEADAKVIAVDFDLRSPVPDGKPRETPEYQKETDSLIAAIGQACSDHHAVVLPAAIAWGPDKSSYVLQSNIYSDSKLPTRYFFTGYIALPTDARQVPLALKLSSQGMIDSFALAAVRAYRPNDALSIESLNLFPYGDYLEPGKFPQLSASSVMSIDNSLLRENVAGKLVLIGSNWHRLAWGTGPLNDSHLTPVGSISGVFVHANYAEAILETDYHRQPPDWFADAVEGLVLLSMAVLFAGKMNSWKKMAVVVSATFLFITLGYMLLQNLGIYFDFLIPLVFLMLHVLADKVLEWRRIALAREKEPQLA